MNYELAKELQDAGWVYKDGTRSVGPTATPTLEELIEACGDDNLLLGRDHKGWSAQTNNKFTRTFTDDYSTPTEAVARLWLALNPSPITPRGK